MRGWSWAKSADKAAAGDGRSVSAAERSVAIAGNNTNSPITIGLDEEGVRRILREEIPQLAQAKGVPEAPLRAVLERLGEKHVSEAEIPVRLAAAADELIRLRADLARLRNDRPEFAAIRARAVALIDRGEIDAARAALREGRAAARALREEISRSEAGFLADEARIDRLQLNPDSALEKFTEAARLDPENIWVWLELSDLWRPRGSLAEAEKACQSALNAALATGIEHDIGACHDRIGYLQQMRGDLPAALLSYRAALAIAETLASRDPGNTEWQRDLIVSYVKVSEVDPAAAPRLLARALEIARRLEAEGRLAPVDAWMPGDLARMLAALKPG